MSAPFVFVPCSGSKADGDELPAVERYTGTLHRLAMRAALAITDEQHVLIVSAFYGLLKLDDMTKPYDARIDGLNFDDARALRGRVQAGVARMFLVDGFDPLDSALVSLCPRPYTELLLTAPAIEQAGIVRPLDDCGGIGGMRSVLSTLARDGRRVA